MVIYGYVKQYQYSNDGTLLIQARVPSIHGPYDITNAKGKTVKNYVRDDDLPWYPSVLLPHLPNEGEVVAILATTSSASSNKIIIGLTGGSYYAQQQGDLNG